MALMALEWQQVLPILGAGLAFLLAWLDARLKSRRPDLYYTPTNFNKAVLDQCPTLHR